MPETQSEHLTGLACSHYAQLGKAKITKNDPHIRLSQGRLGFQRLVYSGSSGLDFSGVVSGGTYISFEVKETERLSFSLLDVYLKDSQRLRMEKEAAMGGETFLLIWFKNAGQGESKSRKPQGQWYRLEWSELKRGIDLEFPSLPIKYFQAFGRIVPFDKGYPEFLSPEVHPWSKQFVSEFPGWMPRKRYVCGPVFKAKPTDNATSRVLENPNLTDREKRILIAAGRGVEHAEKRERKLSIYKDHSRDK